MANGSKKHDDSMAEEASAIGERAKGAIKEGWGAVTGDKAYDEDIRKGGIVMGVNPRTDEDAEYFEREWKSNRGENIYR